MSTEKKTENENIVFSDSDSDDEHKCIVPEEVGIRLQENTNVIARGFKDFLSKPSFIKNKGDPDTNIVDIYCKKCYYIPDKKIGKFMKFIEIMRRKKLKMMIYEKQQEYSGIMLDFDFKLKSGGSSLITHTHYHRFCMKLFKILLKYLHFNEDELGTQKEYYVCFTKKPKILHDSDGDYYKDGRHALIPEIQISREFKKLIIDELINENVMESTFKEIIPHDSITKNDFIDKNSAHVGTFFIGSSSKANTPPYEIDMIYKIQITVGDIDDIIPIDVTESFLNPSNNNNISYEFSLNYEKNHEKGGILIKQRFNIKSEFQSLLLKHKSTKTETVEFENEHFHNELSLLNMHDPDANYIKSILDILKPERSEDYLLWFDVLCTLAHTSPSYKSLGEYFSMKSVEKYDPVYFNKIWNSILIKKNNSLSIGSLHFWAKEDNPDRYEEVRYRSVFNLLFKKIYEPMVEGQMGHYDLAEVLHCILKDKYVYDRRDEEGVSSWYEFILPNEPMVKGELFKWRKYNGDIPLSFLRYISEILPILYNKCLEKIKSTLEDTTEELQKYHFQIYKNFQNSCRSLKNSGYKKSSASEGEQKFEHIGFSEKLDTNPNLKGVANGILELGKKCKLITGYHGHLVSKYTNINYKEFNPYDPVTKKVLIALRNLFPDNEPDTFNYIMHFLSSTLDGNKKESMMLLLVGKGSNGKSFLVELHKGAIGSIYGVKMPVSFLTSRSKDAESATPALMQLKDAHFAYYSESNKFEVLNMAKIKEFTGQETLAGRRLHKDYVNFKPKCHHLVASNNDFEVNGTDHGTWRRLDYLTMKIKFCDPLNDIYDPTNLYERIGDPSMGSNWTEDEEVLSSYLGILVHYYESLQNNFSGKVRSVPHPHITKETEEFRSRQDRMNNFLNSNMVKCEDPNDEIPITTMRDIYVRWHENLYPGGNKEYQRTACDSLENSKLQKFIKKNTRGTMIKGFRVLELGEDKTDGEEFYTDLFEDNEKDLLKVGSETTDEFYKRVCKEYDERNVSNEKQNNKSFRKDKECSRVDRRSKQKIDSDSDSDITEDLKKNGSELHGDKKKKKYTIIKPKTFTNDGIKTVKTKPKTKPKTKTRSEFCINPEEESDFDSNKDSNSDNSDDK
jgi:phage/plasmid-associated DNA primase